ncbi:9140_t:CDS:2 [Funneliformis caledonium]|uniref:9140_t:CDS:1 n=1 Tax=Funneliformis caledonium TaxID=1117310 RepID=A0A9N9DCC2_9GLOM|nr:9140_t:CDS:2 [Funneliformis caledonium]
MATSTRRNSKKTTPSRNELVNDPLATFIPVKNRQTRENNKKSQKYSGQQNHEKQVISVDIDISPLLNEESNKESSDKSEPIVNTSKVIAKKKSSISKVFASTISISKINDDSIVMIEDQVTPKRKGDFNNKDTKSKMIRLDEKDLNLLMKALKYSQKTYVASLKVKEAAIRTETALNEYIRDRSSQDEDSNKITESGKTSQKKTFWYSILTNEEMRDFIYFALIDTHPDEVDKLENSKGGWINYWIEVLQSTMRNEIRYFSRYKAATDDVIAWKTSQSTKWASENLWNKVEENGDESDTYMNCITKEVLKKDERTTHSCAFVVAVVDLMFDSSIQTTILSGELITRRIKEREMIMQKDQEEEIQSDTE